MDYILNDAEIATSPGNAEEIKALAADLTQIYKPTTPKEQILIERLAASEWQYSRALRLLSEDQQTRNARAGQ